MTKVATTPASAWFAVIATLSLYLEAAPAAEPSVPFEVARYLQSETAAEIVPVRAQQPTLSDWEVERR